MSDSSVGQLALLNCLTKKYLDRIQPASIIFLGIAGGNGLEHIDLSVTDTVIGIDINQNYLDETRKRYQQKIKSLELINYDLTQTFRCLLRQI
jgi:nucleoside phosphorylase